MAKEILTFSENGKHEYCATIVKIGTLNPIAGSDFLVSTIVNGFSCVVRKDEVKEGDLMIYCKNETALNSEFLSKNNLYEIGEFERNENRETVRELINNNDKDSARKLCGFYNKHGRVRMIKLRGIPSYGCLFNIKALAKWDASLADLDLSQYIKYADNGELIPFDFDTVNGVEFIKVYVPYVKTPHTRSVGGRGAKATKKAEKRFDRLVPGEFVFHYDTNQLNSNMWRFNPEQNVAISVKEHGTSFIVANVLTNIPKKLTLKEHLLNCVYKPLGLVSKAMKAKVVKNYYVDYGPVYASRTVIKNKFINKLVNGGFYNVDLWSEYGEHLYHILDKGMTIYGEIVGYTGKNASMIQKGYDYGCEVNTNKCMIYRITTTNEDGTKREWNVDEVRDWTTKFIETVSQWDDIDENTKWCLDHIKPINVLYHGKFGDLYPEISTEEHWNENVLARLKSDKERFGMELDEPMCKNAVPREGIVIRIDDDTTAEAFKLKTDKFMGREAKEIDNGAVDIEMDQSYADGGSDDYADHDSEGDNA